MGATLVQERHARGLVQPQMADLLGVSLRQYQRWEHGSSVPRGRQLDRIRAVLGARTSDVGDEVAALREELSALRAEVAATRAELEALTGEAS